MERRRRTAEYERGRKIRNFQPILSRRISETVQNRTKVTITRCHSPVAEVTSRRRLRSASSSALVVPATRRSSLGYRAFPVAGPRAWNSLPEFVTDCSSPLTFKKYLKTYLFRARFDCVALAAYDAVILSHYIMTNRKSHMRFRLVPKSMTLDDLELP